MIAFVEIDFTDDESVSLNKVQCNQQVVFYVDVFDASYKAPDRRYLTKCPPEKVWSTFLLLQEKAPAKDFKLWELALSISSHQEDDHSIVRDALLRKGTRYGHGIMTLIIHRYTIYRGQQWIITCPLLFQTTCVAPIYGLLSTQPASTRHSKFLYCTGCGSWCQNDCFNADGPPPKVSPSTF
jgi:hypothetical protein